MSKVLQVAIFQDSEAGLNEWLKNIKDVEIVDIKPYGGSADNPYLLVIYSPISKRSKKKK